ncbi:MAG: histidine phosphatase family protein [Actinomycetota bacterium]
MATRVHLVRHGEVHNPGHVVYAGLPGFSLSRAGTEQARAVARYLGRQPVVAVWASPLERALRTAEAVAGRLGMAVRVDPRLAEWQLMDRWAGVAWDDLPEKHPGELEAFLAHPASLEFAPESLVELGGRMAASIRELESEYPHGDVVVVSHSAPLRAATLVVTGAPLDDFWDHRPGHGAVTTLRPGSTWKVETIWEPDQTDPDPTEPDPT